MDLNRYTEKGQEAVLAARSLAARGGQQQIEPEHLLLAMLADTGPAGRILKEFGLTRDRLMRALQEVRGHQVHGLYVLMVAAERERLRVLQRLLKLRCELVLSHRRSAPKTRLATDVRLTSGDLNGHRGYPKPRSARARRA